MVKSLPLWAIVVSYFCEYWLLSTVMAYTPTYISSVLQANLRDVSTKKADLAIALLYLISFMP